MNQNLIPGIIMLIAMISSSCSSDEEPRTSQSAPSRPNVLLIITDDQGWGDITSHGNDTISTPNLDQLASESYRFDRFYVSPVCAPTRASLLTGRYHLRTGVNGVTNRREVMRTTELTLAELFKAEDYLTSYFGKWHNGAQYPNNPQGQGFEHFFGFCAGHWNNYFNTKLEWNGEMRPTQGYIADVITDSAIAQIKKSGRLPFFQYVSYNTPHSPFQVPDKYFNKYKDKGLDDKLACIYGMVENIDDNVGRILKTIEDQNLSERTIVIFLTDNGPNTWRFNGNMKGKKAWVDEGGVRVPCFMKIPWLNDEMVRLEQMTAHIDLFPTLAKLCKIELPEGIKLDGKDISILFDDPGKDLPERFIYTDRGVNSKVPYALRSDRYLLTVRKDTLLFDLSEDPFQKNDISAHFPEIVEDYLQRYNKWYRDVTAFGLDAPPIEIGHGKYPTVKLPAHEAIFSGKVHFQQGNGWANDWLTNFQNPGDRISWNIKVIDEGYYYVNIELNSPSVNEGYKLSIQHGVLKSEVTLNNTFLATVVPSPDRVERIEIVEKIWPVLESEEIFLEEGTYYISIGLNDKELPGKIDIKSIEINKMKG